MKRLVVAILLIIIIGGGAYQYYVRSPLSATAVEALTIAGSGTIEAETITIAAETGGRISGVYVNEGSEVAGGDLLVTLDAGLLLAQQAELEAAITTAKANLAAVMSSSQPEEIAVAKAGLDQAQAQRDSAHLIWQQTLGLVDNPQALLVPIQRTQANIKQAEGAVERAKAARKTAAIQEEAASRNQSSHAALVGYEIAKKQHQAAGLSVELAEMNLRALKRQLAHLWEQYNNPVALQAQANQAETGYHVAQAAVALSEARLAAVEAGPVAEEIAVAQAQVRQAESALTLLEVQLAQLSLTAPRDGLITTRVADLGELAAPGATLLKLADLNHVTLRVFIPETQIGQVTLGQKAEVTIDSFDRPFEGSVTYIATEAEFTPKNVQTEVERVNLVFAVEISLDNPEQILKPGMPADAEILIR